jgi:excisionase family DNA binding protein
MAHYMTVEELSRRLRIKEGTCRNRLSRGDDMPPAVRVGRRVLFPEDAFDRWMLERILESVRQKHLGISTENKTK